MGLYLTGKTGEIVAQARRKANMKAQKLADESDVSQVHIYRIEKGIAVPSDDLCIRLAKALRMDKTLLMLNARMNDKRKPGEVRGAYREIIRALEIY